jgi:hypothetical protein
MAGRPRRGARGRTQRRAKEIPQADIDRWSIDSDTPAGWLCHLGPTVRLSEIHRAEIVALRAWHERQRSPVT